MLKITVFIVIMVISSQSRSEPLLIKPEHLREYIVQPTLEAMGEFNPKLNTDAAVELLLGTAAQESDLGFFLHQGFDGGGLGIYQIEAATHEDVWRYLRRPENEELGNIILTFTSQADDKSLIGNLHYATAIARVKYWMRPEPLPETIDQQAIYYKAFYNTASGAATPQEYVASYERFVDSAP